MQLKLISKKGEHIIDSEEVDSLDSLIEEYGDTLILMPVESTMDDVRPLTTTLQDTEINQQILETAIYFAVGESITKRISSITLKFDKENYDDEVGYAVYIYESIIKFEDGTNSIYGINGGIAVYMDDMDMNLFDEYPEYHIAFSKEQWNTEMVLKSSIK